MAARLRFAPGAAREVLRANDEWQQLLPDPSWTTTRELPNPLLRPCVTIVAPGNNRINVRQSQVRLMVNVWVPKSEVLQDMTPPVEIDPEEHSWDIAALAADILDMKSMMGRGPSFEFRGQTWRGQWINGPITMVDKERGEENPLFRSIVEVVMTITTPQ